MPPLSNEQKQLIAEIHAERQAALKLVAESLRLRSELKKAIIEAHETLTVTQHLLEVMRASRTSVDEC